MSEAEWRYLDSVMTPHYCGKVEFQCERALNPRLQMQVTDISEESVVIAMWCDKITGDAIDDDAEKVETDEGAHTPPPLTLP